MTDASKRRTLKGLAAVAAGTASAGLSSSVLANNTNPNVFDKGSTNDHLNFETKVSAQTNDIGVVISNPGNETLSINTLTPHEITTFRGKIDLKPLTEGKPLVLAPGEQVSVALSAHDKSLKINERIHHAQSLSQALKTSATAISSDGNPIPISVNPFNHFLPMT